MILKQVYVLCTYVEFLPQRCERFHKVVEFAQLELDKTGAKLKWLNIDVSTQWNSTFQMFHQAIQLQRLCIHSCTKDKDTFK